MYPSFWTQKRHMVCNLTVPCVFLLIVSLLPLYGTERTAFLGISFLFFMYFIYHYSTISSIKNHPSSTVRRYDTLFDKAPRPSVIDLPDPFSGKDSRNGRQVIGIYVRRDRDVIFVCILIIREHRIFTLSCRQTILFFDQKSSQCYPFFPRSYSRCGMPNASAIFSATISFRHSWPKTPLTVSKFDSL